MIVVRLVGGLGNQMFQYATGRALAHRHGIPLHLDLSAYETFALSPYRLDDFAVRAEVASAADVRRIRDAHAASRLSRAAVRFPVLRAFCSNFVANERHFHFDGGVLRLRGNVYLDGYWQSPKYFAAIEPLIREELSVRTAPDAFNRDLASRISAGESVSVHVRRGDYVSNPATLEFHGTCSPAYYQTAVARLIELGVQPEIFVFSDDPDWAREHIRFDRPTTYVIQPDPSRAFEDLRLMTQCAHHVTANSSFSWWGAWLARRPGQRVVAPRNWFRDPSIDTSDLIPTDWIRL